jgi:hypothetical protein
VAASVQRRPCVGEGAGVPQGDHERGERVHGSTVAPGCDVADSGR